MGGFISSIAKKMGKNIGQVNVPTMPDGSNAGPMEEAGVYSPSQKRAMAIQQQQQLQLQQMQLQAYLAQVAEQKRNNDMQEASMGINLPVYMAMQGGEAAGKMLGGFASRIFGRGQQEQPTQEQVPQEGMTSLVEDRKYQRLQDAMKLPAGGTDPDRKRLALAQQLMNHPDPYFREKGAQLYEYYQAKVMESAKKVADVNKTNADADATRATTTKPTRDSYREGGQWATSETVYDPATGKWNTKVVARGNPTNKTENVGPLTNTQTGEQYKNFISQATFSMRAKDSLGRIADGIRQGAAVGWGSKGVQLVNNTLGTLKQFIGGTKIDEDARSYMNQFASSGGFKKLAEITQINQSRWMEVAYAIAKANNPTGNITRRDVEDALMQLGGDSSDPDTVLAVLEDLGARLDRDVDIQYDSLEPENRKAAESIYRRYDDYRTAQPADPGEPDDPAPSIGDIEAQLKKRGLKP